MRIDIITLFPKMFEGTMNQSIMWRAQDKNFIDLNIIDLRQFGDGLRKNVDDRPYGGGKGMIFRVDVVYNAIKDLKSKKSKIILLSPQGKLFNQKKAKELAKSEHIILICGHYEGVDHRVHEHIADEVISIGDYVLSGGELPAMVVVDTIVRLLPGGLGNEQSLTEESHNTEEVEYPQYTRPEDYNGWKVPEVLLSGDHAKIKKWRENK